MLVFVALAAVTATQPAPVASVPQPTAPELWRGARLGMTSNQVKALFPDARPAASQLFTRPPVPNTVAGATATWAVDEQVFGRSALATYYFAPSGGLLEVVVTVNNLRLRHTRDNVEVARGIRAGLVQYYGVPKVCLDTADHGLDRLDCRWTTRGVQVGLSYVDYGGLSPNLDVAVRGLPTRLYEQGPVFRQHGGSSF